ncbi:MAG: hypothetical protein AAB373_04460 [Patescibacteria group bacterium]
MSDKFENKKEVPKQSIADNWLDHLTDPAEAVEIKKMILKNLFFIARHYQYGSIESPDLTNSQPKNSDENLKNSFATYEMILKKMEIIYPEDGDLAIIKKLLKDLESDLYKSTEGRNLSFDESVADILVHEEGKDSKKINIKSNEEIPMNYFKLLEEIISLKSMGIEPDYAVLSENPNAPTLVLFLEHHFEGKGRSSKSSNAYMEEAFRKAINNNFITDIYAEGGEENTVATVNKEIVEKNKDKFGAIFRIAAEFGEKVNIIGTEFEELKKGNTMDEIVKLDEISKLAGKKTPEERTKYYSKKYKLTLDKIKFQRATFENIFMAMNIRDTVLDRKSKIVFGVIGSAHETNKSFRIASKGLDHPLPLSSVLANNGINVIVVDATTK